MDRKVLHVEDDPGIFQEVRDRLSELGIGSVQAASGAEALELATTPGAVLEYVAVLLDLGIAPGRIAEIKDRVGPLKTVGQATAELIRMRNPKTPLLAVSRHADRLPVAAREWFNRNSLDAKGCRGFYGKSAVDYETLYRRLVNLAFPERQADRVPFFIIHGHDVGTRDQLCGAMARKTRIEPIVLDVSVHPGTTIIEQFEDHASCVAGAFALFTEDDWGQVGARQDAVSPGQARVRQNVIFEVGYCLGKFGRRSGRIFLLKKGNPEIPSDLAGFPLISLDTGVEEAVDQMGTAIDRFI